MPKHIYRIESPNGNGLFDVEQADEFDYYDFIAEVALAHEGDDRPSIFEDCPQFNIFNVYDWFCGCESLEALKDWFGSFWDGIVEIPHLSLVRYEVDEKHLVFGKSGRQIFFLKHKAKNRTILNK